MSHSVIYPLVGRSRSQFCILRTFSIPGASFSLSQPAELRLLRAGASLLFTALVMERSIDTCGSLVEAYLPTAVSTCLRLSDISEARALEPLTMSSLAIHFPSNPENSHPSFKHLNVCVNSVGLRYVWNSTDSCCFKVAFLIQSDSISHGKASCRRNDLAIPQIRETGDNLQFIGRSVLPLLVSYVWALTG